jgi:transcriptional regulator with XRE-family HTH domain
MTSTSNEDTSLSVPELVSLLFGHQRRSDGTTYTERDVAQATGMSQSTLSAIRRGIIQNPRIDSIKALCRFFQVKLDYFDSSSVAEALEHMAAGRTEAPHDMKLAMRLNRLTDDARRDLDRIIDYVMHADRAMNNTISSEDE